MSSGSQPNLLVLVNFSPCFTYALIGCVNIYLQTISNFRGSLQKYRNHRIVSEIFQRQKQISDKTK